MAACSSDRRPRWLLKGCTVESPWPQEAPTSDGAAARRRSRREESVDRMRGGGWEEVGERGTTGERLDEEKLGEGRDRPGCGQARGSEVRGKGGEFERRGGERGEEGEATTTPVAPLCAAGPGRQQVRAADPLRACLAVEKDGPSRRPAGTRRRGALLREDRCLVRPRASGLVRRRPIDAGEANALVRVRQDRQRTAWGRQRTSTEVGQGQGQGGQCRRGAAGARRRRPVDQVGRPRSVCLPTAIPLPCPCLPLLSFGRTPPPLRQHSSSPARTMDDLSTGSESDYSNSCVSPPACESVVRRVARPAELALSLACLPLPRCPPDSANLTDPLRSPSAAVLAAGSRGSSRPRATSTSPRSTKSISSTGST